jgi:hypothetical protein
MTDYQEVSEMRLSQHAQVRCQQRGIPPLIRQWLLDYGAEVMSHGATKRYFDKAARRKLAADVGPEVLDRMGDLLNLYLVEGERMVVTAGVRTRRIKRR